MEGSKFKMLRDKVFTALDTALAEDKNELLKTYDPWAVSCSLCDAGSPRYIHATPEMLTDHVVAWQAQWEK
jgi:hypothetical protein